MPHTELALANVFRRIIVGQGKAWVLFRNGTCVIVAGQTSAAAAATALDLMREWGPVHVGSSAGDFSVITLRDAPGWVVSCHHPDILSYVPPDELGANPSELSIGMAGRARRDSDARELEVIHVEGGAA